MIPEIERLAKEAGFVMRSNIMESPVLYRFAALIAEECAKECAAMPYSMGRENSSGTAYIHVMNPEDCARAIRAKFALSHREDAAK